MKMLRTSGFGMAMLLAWCTFHAVHAAPDMEPDLAAPPPSGTWEQVEAPDTLDLAERARWAVNVLTGNLDPEKFYALYQVFDYDTSATRAYGLTWNLTAENLGALPLMRQMSGSTQGLEIETAAMRTLLRQLESDGLMFYPLVQDGAPKDTSYPQVNANFALAMANWYERDRDPRWLALISQIAGGLDAKAIRAGDRAFFPNESSLGRDGKWHWTEREGRENAPIPYYPPDEPIVDQQGLEGAVKIDHGKPIYALAKMLDYHPQASPPAVGAELTRFVLKPGMWELTSNTLLPGYQHGVYAGHHHNNLATLIGLLEWARVNKDTALKSFVREAYQHGVRSSVMRAGFVPGWVEPLRFGRPAVSGTMTEVCAVAEMLILAVKLSDLGLGDYWDDVDAIARNHLSACQMLDTSGIAKKYGVTPAGQKNLERFRGGFACTDMSALVTPVYGCCTANGSLALYYAWEGITRLSGKTATVNLWLNRASPWLDVESWLPQQGRVVLRNKTAQRILTRMPVWLDPAVIRATVNGSATQPDRTGRYLVFEQLKPGDTVELNFPLPEETMRYTVTGTTYTLNLRGANIVNVSPRNPDPKKWPIFVGRGAQREPAPVERKWFVADSLIPPP